MAPPKYDLKSSGTLVQQDNRVYWFKSELKLKGEEVSLAKAISLLREIADRELTSYEEVLLLSKPTSGSTTIDIVSISLPGANFMSVRRVVLGYAIRRRESSARHNYGDIIGTDGFWDTEGNLIGKISITRKEEPGLETPFLDPIDFVGAGLSGFVRRAAKVAIEAGEETVARWLARKGGQEVVGGMSGTKSAAMAFWQAGEVTPRAIAQADRKLMTSAIKKRMEELGIPKNNIGIRAVVGESGEAFTAEGSTRGANVRGKGISVHGSVMEDWKGFPEWNNATLRDRVDSVIAHEWMEFNELTHWETVELALETKLHITKGAKDLLSAMRKYGKGAKALEDKVPPK